MVVSHCDVGVGFSERAVMFLSAKPPLEPLPFVFQDRV